MGITNPDHIANKVVANAAKAQLQNKLFFSTIAGIVVPDRDLSGVGAGDTKVFTQFDLNISNLQVLNIGDEIATSRLTQSQYEVKIEQLAYGKLFYDAEIKTSLSGGQIDSESASQIGLAFAEGLDNLTLAALLANSQKEVGPLSVQTILEKAEAKYGENVYDGSLAALAIHPTKAKELRNDPDFQPATDYTNKTYGAQEIGKLYGILPVILLNKVTPGATAGAYQNIIVPKASVLNVIGKDLNVERERIAKKRATEITADVFVGFKGIKEGIIFEG